MHLKKRHCFIKMPNGSEARRFVVRILQPNRLDDEETREYEKSRYEAQGAISPSAADAILTADRNAFIERGRIQRKKPAAQPTPPRI
jgi:hypothetical protein